LRWQDVDLVQGTVAVRVTRLQGKGGVFVSTPKSNASQRPLTLLPGALDALARLRDVHDALRARLGDLGHDWVLLAGDGAPIRPATLTRRWHAALRDAGLRRIRLHDARHTHGTLLADAGVPVHAISARLGHASVATTMHFYVHAGTAADRNAADVMQRVLQSSVGSNLVAERRETGAHGDGAQRRNPATTPLGEREKHGGGGPGRDRTYDQGIMRGVKSRHRVSACLT
jgi:integrase